MTLCSSYLRKGNLPLFKVDYQVARFLQEVRGQNFSIPATFQIDHLNLVKWRPQVAHVSEVKIPIHVIDAQAWV